MVLLPTFSWKNFEHHFRAFLSDLQGGNQPTMKRKREDEPARRRVMARTSQFQPSLRTMNIAPRPRSFSVSENKYFDSFLAGGEIAEATSWAGAELDPTTLDTLFAPSEGSDLDNRVGRRVAVYKIALRGIVAVTVTGDNSDVTPAPAFRLILYVDKQSNAAQSQAEQLMAAPGSATATLTMCTFQNLANLGRFEVLKDKTYRTPTITAASDNAGTAAFTNSQACANVPIKMTRKFQKPLLVRFNATNGGTIADIVDNSFHIIGQKSATGFQHFLHYQCRVYYKDA